MSDYLPDNLKRSKRNLIATSAAAVAIQSFDLAITKVPSGIGDLALPERFVPIVLGVSLAYFLFHFSYYAFQEWRVSTLVLTKEPKESLYTSIQLRNRGQHIETISRFLADLEGVSRASAPAAAEFLLNWAVVFATQEHVDPLLNRVATSLSQPGHDFRFSDEQKEPLVQLLSSIHATDKELEDSYKSETSLLAFITKSNTAVDFVMPTIIGLVGLLSTIWPEPLRQALTYWIG